MVSPDNRLSHRLLDDLAGIVAATLAESVPVAPEVAEAVGERTAHALVKNWGGSMIYFPINRKFKGLAMHRALYDRHLAGETPEQLRRAFGISLQWTYAIIKRMKAMKKAASSQESPPPKTPEERPPCEK